MQDSMNGLSELLTELRLTGQTPERALLERVKALGPAVVQPLIAMATDESLHYAEQESPQVWAPLHAVQILGELEAAEAVEPLLPLLEMDDDWLHEAVPEALGRIGQPALHPLRAFLYDRTHDPTVRAIAGDGFVQMARHHPELRGEAVGALVAFLDRPELGPPDDPTLTGLVISQLCDLRATEAVSSIWQAFNEARVDLSMIEMGDVVRQLGLDFPTRETRKVGRNDPCPCGSGKKYKKCHGK